MFVMSNQDRNRKVVRPLPSIPARRGPFSIAELKSHGGGVSYKERKFAAPLDSTEEANAVRLHEYIHLTLRRKKITPGSLNPILRAMKKKRGEVNLAILQLCYWAASDAIVNGRAYAIGRAWEISSLKAFNSESAEEYVNSLVNPYSPAEEKALIALAFARAKGLDQDSDYESKVAPLLEKVSPEWFTVVSQLRDLYGALLNFATHRDADTDLRTRLVRTTIAFYALLLSALSAPEEGKERGKEEEKGEAEIDYKPTSRDDPTWGRLEEIEIPLRPWRPRSGVMQKRFVPSFTGAFRYPHRALVGSDYRCFGIKRPRPGIETVVLLDLSGSMHIDQQELELLMENIPRLQLYAYSARDRITGQIARIADGKRMLIADAKTVRDTMGHYNIVDLPALMFVRRRYPKAKIIWISDGYVTGKYEEINPILNAQVAAFNRRNRIVQYLSIPLFLRALGIKKGGEEDE